MKHFPIRDIIINKNQADTLTTTQDQEIYIQDCIKVKNRSKQKISASLILVQVRFSHSKKLRTQRRGQEATYQENCLPLLISRMTPKTQHASTCEV